MKWLNEVLGVQFECFYTQIYVGVFFNIMFLMCMLAINGCYYRYIILFIWETALHVGLDESYIKLCVDISEPL